MLLDEPVTCVTSVTGTFMCRGERTRRLVRCGDGGCRIDWEDSASSARLAGLTRYLDHLQDGGVPAPAPATPDATVAALPAEAPFDAVAP